MWRKPCNSNELCQNERIGEQSANPRGRAKNRRCSLFLPGLLEFTLQRAELGPCFTLRTDVRTLARIILHYLGTAGLSRFVPQRPALSEEAFRANCPEGGLTREPGMKPWGRETVGAAQP